MMTPTLPKTLVAAAGVLLAVCTASPAPATELPLPPPAKAAKKQTPPAPAARPVSRIAAAPRVAPLPTAPPARLALARGYMLMLGVGY